MWPFTKKYPPRSEIKLAEALSFFHGEQHGKPLVARFDAKASALVGHPEYPYQVGIAFPLNAPAENGLTTDEENAQLHEYEEQLTALLRQDNESLKVGAITTNGVKEYVFYTASPDGVKAKFEQFSPGIASHHPRLKIQEDADWGAYTRFVK